MTQRIAGTDSNKPHKPGQFPKGVSGNPLGGRVLRARAERLYDEIAAEMGTMSAVERAMLAQATNFLARAQSAKDPRKAVPLFNAGIRALASIRNGLEPSRGGKPPSTKLAEHLKQMVEGPQSS
jgi:hypothetical protein